MSITPTEDGTLLKLLVFLQQYLNDVSAEYFASVGAPPQIAVGGLEIGQTDLAGVQKFPLLMGYRLTFSGDGFQNSTANLDYFILASVISRVGQDAWFTWIAKHIAIALDDYNNIDDNCMSITGLGEAQIRYATTRGRAGGEMTIPFLRVPFRFEDYELIA